MEDWNEDDYRIFVGDLGNEVCDEHLAAAFQKYPSFLKAKVIRNKITAKDPERTRPRAIVVGCVVLQPMARQLHPLLAQQLESAGVDLPSLGHHGSSLLSLLHEISRTYERANVPCPPSAPLPRSRPSSLGAATAVHACNTATSSPGPSVSSGDPVIAHAEVLENLGGNPEARPACLSPGRRG